MLKGTSYGSRNHAKSSIGALVNLGSRYGLSAVAVVGVPSCTVYFRAE